MNREHRDRELREATEAERAQQACLAAAQAEIEGMRCAYDGLYKLSEPAKRRALHWLDGALFGHGNEEPPF